MTPQDQAAIDTILELIPGAYVESHKDLRPQVEALGCAERDEHEPRAAIIEEGDKVTREQAERAALGMIQEKKHKAFKDTYASVVNVTMACAKAYAARGWPVLPLVPGEKTPLVAGGFHAATLNPKQIEAWWARWPDAGVGIATGQASGLLVVDVDKKHGGEVTMREHTQAHGRPYTLMAKTPSGGWHVYFELPQDTVVKSSNGDFGKGVDIRGDGGYIVAAPTPGYSWLIKKEGAPLDLAVAAGDEKLERLPMHMLARIRAAENGEGFDYKKQDWAAIAGQKIDHGNRDSTVTSVAGALVRGCQDEFLLMDVLDCWNRARCNPPLEARDIERIARSILKKHSRGNP